ncbi:MAG: SDR family NAD(P)-dependent oxidoreductase [Beutenbergiaceae bacterium]
MSVAGRTVLIAGATSASGRAAIGVLHSAGARVVAVGRDPDRLAAVIAAHGSSEPRLRTEVCDLADQAQVVALAQRLSADRIRLDGILHLVGGWRGGGGVAGQTEADYRFMEGGLTALRHVTRAFDADLRAAVSARVAIVSSPAVERPSADGANYAAVKAAEEAWARALADGFSRDAASRRRQLHAAAVIFRVVSLDGLEQRLARAYADLWEVEAAPVNGTVVPVTA